MENEVLNVDDMIETVNHFLCIDMIIDNAKAALTEKVIKEFYLILKNGTSDSGKEWNNEKGYLTVTCLTVQDKYKAYLDYFF